MSTTTWRAVWVDVARRLGGEADEARWICQQASGRAGLEWIGALDAPVTVAAMGRVEHMVGRRLAGEPLAYVLGAWGFRHLDLMVDRRVLIPRPETELLVDVALEVLADRPPPLVVVDLGTGSGAVALALAAELPRSGVQIWATDASADALDVARANIAGLGRPGANVRLAQGDWYEALGKDLRGRVDLVVANPPYVADAEALDPSVADWEPAEALRAGPDGLDDLGTILAGALAWLAPGGAVVVEVGATQGAAVRRLATAAGLVGVEGRRDLAGHERIVLGRRD